MIARPRPEAIDAAPVAVIITARNEADRLAATLAAVAGAFPGARRVVADDASDDASAEVAARAGAEVVRAPRRLGKGGAATLAARRVLARAGPHAGATQVIVLCDGDLGASASRLGPLAERVSGGDCDLAVAAFARRVGGGFGLALGFGRWTVLRLGGLDLHAPLSGQRALRREVLEAVVPFAPRFAMEVAMTLDAAAAGFRICELELELEHRPTGRTAAGFVHRGRQLVDLALLYASRRGASPRRRRRD